MRHPIRTPLGALAGLAGLAAAAAGGHRFVSAADHIDAPLTLGDQSADIADVYAFRRGDDLVLAMTISNVQAAPEIELGRSILDPEVLYQFEIDRDGDAVEDLVLQAFVTGPPTGQTLHVRGPAAPPVAGATARLLEGTPTTSVAVSTDATPRIGTANGLTVFAGVRDDPFFFDFGRFQEILAGQASSFDDPGTDTFAGLNVYAIVVAVPLSMLGGDPSALGVWGTTHRP